jgi:hypothetical protein
VTSDDALVIEESAAPAPLRIEEEAMALCRVLAAVLNRVERLQQEEGGSEGRRG